MTLHEYPRLDEKIYRTTLSNGLDVMVVPKPGFSRKIAYFATDYGAVHTAFSFGGETYRAPDGIAHFLEHKLFDMPGQRDVSAEFAARGAFVNAFTSYDMTAYYFSTTENFDDCLKLLLEFVSTPYFTEESVEKVQRAVKAACSFVLMYGEELIEAVYFSCSGGQTEAAVAVWGADFPYLQSVESPGEEHASHYTDTVSYTSEAFQQALGVTLPGRANSWFGEGRRTVVNPFPVIIALLTRPGCCASGRLLP